MAAAESARHGSAPEAPKMVPTTMIEVLLLSRTLPLPLPLLLLRVVVPRPRQRKDATLHLCRRRRFGLC